MIYSEEEVEDDCSTRAWKIESEIDSSFDRSGEIGERKPHRTITNWYLVKKTRRPNNVENYTPIYKDNIIIDPEKKILNEIRHDSERFIFSEDMRIDPALVLCGEVIMKRHQLQQQQKKKEPSIHVVIEKLKQACFDNHPNERGFWIESGKAWYKLDQPDTYYPQQQQKQSEPQQQKVQFFLSQEDLFLPYRAMSALLSNLLDTMSNHTGYLCMYNVTFLRALTPEEIYERIYQYNYRRLLQKQQQLQYENYHNVYFPNPSTYISILSKESCEPFDIYLLKRKSNFVMRQLTRLRGLMTPSSRRSTISSTITTQSSSSSHNTMCRFMDWLSKTASKAHKTNEIIGAEYLEKVAIAGEQRSSRDKYGYPIYTTTDAHPSEMKWVNQCDLIFRKACIEHHSDSESEEESSNNNNDDDDESDEAAIEGQQDDGVKKSIPHFNRINIMVGEKIHGFISCYLNSEEIDFYIYPNRSETQTFSRRTTTPSITPQVSINHEDDDDHQSNSRSISNSSSDNEREKPTVVSTLQKSDTRSEITTTTTTTTTTTNNNNNKRKKSLISDILMQRPRSQKIQRKK